MKSTDVIISLKNVPFVDENGKLIKRVDSLKNILVNCLRRSGLDLNIWAAVNTYEDSMPTGINDDPLALTYIDTNRFIDTNNKPFSVFDVVTHIFNMFTANVKQVDGEWWFIDISQTTGDGFNARHYDLNGNLLESAFLNKNIIVKPNELINSDLYFENQAAYKSVATYYQYGYLSNKLPNVDFQVINPGPVIDKFANWHTFGGLIVGVGEKTYTLPSGEVPSGDFYAIFENNNVNVYRGFYSDPVSVLSTNTIALSMMLNARYQNIVFNDVEIILQLKYTRPDGSPKYLWYDTNSNQAPVWYDTDNSIFAYTNGKNIYDGFNLNLNIPYAPGDGFLTLTILAIRDKKEKTSVGVFINDVKIQFDENAFYKSAIGFVNRATQIGDFSETPDTTVLLFGDDPNKNRTSWIRLSNGEPTNNWIKDGVASTLQRIITENILTQYKRVSRRAEGSFMGAFSPLDVFTLPLTSGKFIFLSGSVNVKSASYNLSLSCIKVTNKRRIIN